MNLFCGYNGLADRQGVKSSGGLAVMVGDFGTPLGRLFERRSPSAVAAARGPSNGSLQPKSHAEPRSETTLDASHFSESLSGHIRYLFHLGSIGIGSLGKNWVYAKHWVRAAAGCEGVLVQRRCGCCVNP